MVELWTEVSDPTQDSYFTYSIMSVLTNCTSQFIISTSSIWQTSHTQAQNAHSCTQTLTLRCQGRLSPCLTQCYFQVGVGFPFFGCGILLEQETTLYSGIFLMAPIRHRNSDSLILLTICTCHRISHEARYRVLRTTYHPEDNFLITLLVWDDFQVWAELVYLKDLKEKFPLKSIKRRLGNVHCNSRPILIYVFFFLLIHMDCWPNMHDLMLK